MWEWVKPLPNDENLDVTKLKTIADDKLIIAKMTFSLFDRIEKKNQIPEEGVTPKRWIK